MIAIGLLITLAAWLAWMFLLTESELDGDTTAMRAPAGPGIASVTTPTASVHRAASQLTARA